MQIGRHIILLLGALALIPGCTNPPEQQEPATEESRSEVVPAPEPETNRPEAIRAHNEEILERLRREELALKNQPKPQPQARTSAAVTTADEPTRSSMEEMQSRASALEPRVAEIGRIATRVDENFRRYRDACHEKYTTGTTSPHTATPYFDPYQPIAVSNETTPYCRKLLSDIETGANDVDQAMESLAEDARRRGVLPGHLRDLIRKYDLDRNGWRP